MENGKKLIAVENIIFAFAQSQFEANNIQPSEARLIMEAVDGKFQKICLDSVMMGMVQMVDPNKLNGESEEHSGTPEELIKTVEKSGFSSDNKEPVKK